MKITFSYYPTEGGPRYVVLINGGAYQRATEDGAWAKVVVRNLCRSNPRAAVEAWNGFRHSMHSVKDYS